jgi:hypothetical protein
MLSAPAGVRPVDGAARVLLRQARDVGRAWCTVDCVMSQQVFFTTPEGRETARGFPPASELARDGVAFVPRKRLRGRTLHPKLPPPDGPKPEG